MQLPITLKTNKKSRSKFGFARELQYFGLCRWENLLLLKTELSNRANQGINVDDHFRESRK